MRRRRQTPWWASLLACLCVPVIFPVLYPTAKAIQGTIILSRKGRMAKKRYQWSQHRKKVRNTRLPECDPVSLTTGPDPFPLKGRVTFLDLPLEIRQHIYELALGGPCIFQPSYKWSLRGPRPNHWEPWQHVRGDADPCSKALSKIIALGGSGLKPLVRPPQNGCAFLFSQPELVCGDVFAYEPDMEGWTSRVCRHTDLMRVSRQIYGDMLHYLYSDCTISLFGEEMVYYFTRNASPDGLSRVRYVHIALVISSQKWESKKKKQKNIEAIQCLKESFVNLQALDVEIVVAWGQPDHPERLCSWLSNHVFGQLRGLENLVVKIAVYKPLPRGTEHRLRWTPPSEPLRGWDDGKYNALKRAVTSPFASH